MSGMIEKAKLKAEEMLHKSNNKNVDNPHSTNQGPHSSNMANKADPRVDSDRDGSAAYGHNTHNTHNTGLGHNTGVGHNTGYGNTTAGPHDSNLANKADPRVDSDLDGRSGMPGQHGHGGIAQTHHTTTTGTGYGSNTGYGNEPVHNSNLANKLDPRVDSTPGQTGYSQSGVGQTGYGDSSLGHSGVGQTGTGYGNTGYSGSTNAGPHNSNMANKLDPRVDSDMDNRNNPTSRVGGYGTQDNYGTTGTGYGSTGTGVGHSSGHTGVGQTGYGHDQYGSSAIPGSGTAEKTAGPHNSNLMNKLDPRVDSDADGSKTYGGNKTNY